MDIPPSEWANLAPVSKVFDVEACEACGITKQFSGFNEEQTNLWLQVQLVYQQQKLLIQRVDELEKQLLEAKK